MITQNQLKRNFQYNPDTGIFIRKTNTGSRWKIGDKAGSPCNGYIAIKIGPVLYYAHRLAFLYMLGYIPKYVDHIDMNRMNNNWNNLREATSSQNHANYKKHSDNSSGYKGVSFGKDRKHLPNPWYARIMFNYKKVWLGYFETAELAAKAYDEKAIELFGEFASTNFPIDKQQK